MTSELHRTTLALARLATTALALWAGAALAQEAQIRKNLPERLPNLPKIDEVRPTPVPGLFEVRIGTEVLYTDAAGRHVIQGEIIDIVTRTNLTEKRIEQLTAIEFDTLPLKDAMVVKQGNGSRRLAVFADPNCGYCKRFERDLTAVKDVTIYTFLYPILGPDSGVKSRDIWCAKDPMGAWRDWMLENQAPPKAGASCDAAALDRNLALGRKHRISGTPTLVFENGIRKPGALAVAQVDALLAQAARKP